jgi:hypothetical protein
VILFSVAAIPTETPPRACWAKAGEPAKVPVTGNLVRRVVSRALNVGTGGLWLYRPPRWNQDTLQDHLRQLRSQGRTWNIVLFLDRGTARRARGSRALAAELGIEPGWLPTACPELNPQEGLSCEAEGHILANEPTPGLGASLGRALDHLGGMTSRQRLKTAGVLSGAFWLPAQIRQLRRYRRIFAPQLRSGAAINSSTDADRRGLRWPRADHRTGEQAVAISLAEEIRTITSATKLLPARRGDRPVHSSCLFRWAKHGLRGVRLETIRVGGTLCTSREALERFFARLAELDGRGGDTTRTETPARRRREIAEASREAEAALR